MPRILFADDQADIRHMVKLIFERRRPGSEVILAGDGLSAVIQVRRDSVFDLILLDHQMPPDRYGGVHAAKAIRTLAPQVPIFFLSAYTQSSDIYRARQAGAWGYLAKSIIAQPPIATHLLDRDWAALGALADGKSVWVFPENMIA